MDRSEREAAARLCECRAALIARGSSPLREAAGAAGPHIAEGRHYPDGEAYDPATHAQYFYHRHAAADRTRHAGSIEHGHFHLFLRGEGMPPGVMPLLLPEFAVANVEAGATAPRPSAPLKRGGREEVCHLVAVALDAEGEPIRLFTTNRWVTGETWYRADDVIRMLPRFRLADEGPLALVNGWLAALVALYRPEIARLLRQRDRTVIERRWRWRGNVLEDQRLEIASSLDIDLEARLAAVDTSAAEPAPAPVRQTRLPRMAEGWGT